MEINDGKESVSMEKNYKNRIIKSEGKSTLNVSVLMNLHQDFSVDRITMNVQ